MAILQQASLFEAAGSARLNASTDWIESLLLGDVALGLCVLAVAATGALALTGRLPFREGIRVVLGCFVLLGAPVIAAAFVWSGTDVASAPAPLPPVASVEVPRKELQPANYDPYAGASLRRD
ncbi:MAG: TrbC/VirB2 family protein [Pseudomonadota bacterium]